MKKIILSIVFVFGLLFSNQIHASGQDDIDKCDWWASEMLRIIEEDEGECMDAEEYNENYESLYECCESTQDEED